MVRLRAVLAGRSGAALALWGQAGSGKTFAAARLCEAVACPALVADAGAPLAQLVAELSGAAGAGRAGARALRVLERTRRDDADAADALSEVLAGLAPTVLRLEDLHGAAQERVALWRAVARRVLGGRGVVMLATSRSRPPAPFEPRAWGPMARAAAGRLVEAELGGPAPGDAEAWIHGRAAGNPAFTTEYVRFLRRDGSLWHDGTRWRWRPPEREVVPGAVEAMVDRWIVQAVPTPGARAMLEAAALLPEEATPGAWAVLAGLDPDAGARALRGLRRWGLVTRARLAHPLLRPVVLASLDPDRRRELARRALTSGRLDAQVAVRFLDDAGAPPRQVREMLELAAAEAERAGARDRGATYLARAVGYADVTERGPLALRAARALAGVAYDQAARLAELALVSSPEDGDARYLLAELLALQGRLVEAEALLPSGGEGAGTRVHLRALGGDHRGVLELWRGGVGGPDPPPCEGDHAAAAGALRATGAAATAAATGAGSRHDDAVAPLTAAEVGEALLVYGDVRQARAVAERALRGDEGSLRAGNLPRACEGLQLRTRVRLRGILAEADAFEGRFEAAVAAMGRLITELREARATAELAQALGRRASVHQSLGDFAAKRRDLEEAVRLYRGLGDEVKAAEARVALGVLLVEVAEGAEAEAVLLAARAALERAGAWPALVHCERMLCYLYRTAGEVASARLAAKHGQAALRRARRLGGPQLIVNALYEAACGEALGGSPSHALALAEEGLRLAEGLGSGQLAAYCRYARAAAFEALGGRDEALGEYRRALRDVQALGLTMDAHSFALEIDRLTGNRAAADARRSWFEERGQLGRAALARRIVAAPAPAPRAAAGAGVRLQVLGTLRVTAGGAGGPVRGEKRRQLLAALLEARLAGEDDVSRLALLDELYAGLPEASASTSLKQLVFQLRRLLGPWAIVSTARGYALGEVDSDAETFLVTGDAALWRGPYREDAGTGDASVAGALYRALRARAAALAAADPGSAARLARVLLLADGYDEDDLRLLLRSLGASASPAAVAAAYADARERFREVGHPLPSSWEAFLARPGPEAMRVAEDASAPSVGA